MKQFPIVRTEGSHYEVGLAIGKAMQGPIRQALANSKEIFKRDFSARIEASKSFQREAEKYFPQYMEEFRGMTDGAGVSFDEIFLSNCREAADFNPYLSASDRCTIVGIPQERGYVLGHNEDWDASSLSLLYLLDATIDGTRIFGLTYANSLVGDGVAVNGYGLVQGLNELYHTDAQVGVPKNFIGRAVLDARSLEDVERLMKAVPRGGGWNHMLVQGARLWNIESSARESVIEKVEMQKYAHTNHYLTELKRIDKGNAESKKRYAKVKERLEDVSSVDDMKRILSDRAEPPICRAGTIGSVIFDVPSKVAHIAYGQPTPESYMEYSLSHVVG